MAMTGDFPKLHAVTSSLRSLGEPSSTVRRLMAIGAGKAVREYLTETQFGRGIGPDGNPWKPRKDKKPALVSNKLGGDMQWYAVEQGIGFKVFARIPWLRAHHEGHTYPPRKVASRLIAMQHVKDRKNPVFMSNRDVFRRAKRKGSARYDVAGGGAVFVQHRKSPRTDILFRAVVAKEHVIKARVLPRRPVYPTGSVPDPWGKAINRGVEIGLQVWDKAGRPK